MIELNREGVLAWVIGFMDLVGGLAAMVGQLADGPEVTMHRSLGLAGQVQVFTHLLAERTVEMLGTNRLV